jgi:hypothetical protein
LRVLKEFVPKRTKKGVAVCTESIDVCAVHDGAYDISYDGAHDNRYGAYSKQFLSRFSHSGASSFPF